jgi:hypothetical protein
METPERGAISSYLQKVLDVRSPATDYREDESDIQVIFAAPGRRTLVTIHRAERMGEVELENRGMLGRLDDLHKGFDAGATWYWTIDFSAILLTISSLTGMVTLLSLRTRRKSGFIVGAIGVVTVVAIYLICVP